jgi:hypothetical protein
MKITKRQLRQIIKEEKQKLLKEFGPGGTDGASPLLDFAHAYAKLGSAVQEQVEKVVAAHIDHGGESDEFHYAVYDHASSGGIREAMLKLRSPLKALTDNSPQGSDPAYDVREALIDALSVYDEGDDEVRRDAEAAGDNYDSRPTRMS